MTFLCILENAKHIPITFSGNVKQFLIFVTPFWKMQNKSHSIYNIIHLRNQPLCLFHGRIKNEIKGWHILSNMLTLCQEIWQSLSCKFNSKEGCHKRQSQFAFYLNGTDLIQFLFYWTFLFNNIRNQVAWDLDKLSPF